MVPNQDTRAGVMGPRGQSASASVEQRLRRLSRQFRDEGNAQTADKLLQLAERGDRPSAYVAFVGLFSAGKSSLLADICATELETGAIPTTSVVTHLTVPGTQGRVTLLDTPGVDSTDASHREATEGALHMADVIVLVMDYQHVEAEENLELAESFARGKKQLWLVVNQVDKHFEPELPFEAYFQRLKDTFQDWDITYDRLFFTSVRDGVDLNQLKALKAALSNLSESDPLERVDEVIAEHIAWYFGDRLAHMQAQLRMEFGRDVELTTECSEFREKIESALQAVIDEQRDWEEQWQRAYEDVEENSLRSIELAQISAYDTIAKAKAYIASLQPGFRVGWIRRQRQVREEQERRLDAFASDVDERTKQFLIWPLQRELQRMLDEKGWLTANLVNAIQDLAFPVNGSFCRDMVATAALQSDTYPHTYVADVSSRIKHGCAALLRGILNEVIANWRLVSAEQTRPHDARILDLQNQLELLDSCQELQHEQRERWALYEKMMGERRADADSKNSSE